MDGRNASRASEYAAALRAYLATRGEASLLRASALGREALADGLGILDMATIHHECLGPVMDEAPADDREERVRLCGAFFCEAISAFEMAHRGFKEVSRNIQLVMQFAAVVSHELRTPLTSLISSLGMLIEVLHPVPSSIEDRLLANIQRSTTILKGRTDDLLDLVGFQSGALSIHPRGLELGPLLAGVVDRLGGTGPGVDVRLEVSADLPRLSADPDRVEQIVSNLVQNAIKYGAEGRYVDVRAFPRGAAVQIEVQDYGSGIPLRERMKIWQPKFRGAARSVDIPGLGIGLALCKELVEQHAGVITLESEEGKGSLFRVELPIAGPERKEGGHGEGRGD